MFKVVKADNFAHEVLEQDAPVLLAFLQDSGAPLEKQRRVLETFSQHFENIKCCVLDEYGSNSVKDKYNVFGTPTYLLFEEGREKDRLLGSIDIKSLEGFVLQTLQHSRNKKSKA